MFRQIQTTFNFQKYLIAMLDGSVFYSEISRHLSKIPTDSVPTLAVGFNPVNEDLSLGYNPEFCSKLTDLQMRNVIIHEFLHVVCGHLVARRRAPPTLWNIATDCAINSMIVTDSQPKFNSANRPPLPEGCIIPGQWFTMPDGRELTESEKKANELGQIIASLPTMKSSEWYYFKIIEEAQKRGANTDDLDAGLEGRPGGGTLDDHSFWDSIPADKKEIVENKIKEILSKAVAKADTRDGWGNVPLEFQQELRRSLSRVVNWKAVLKQFAGTLIRGKKRTSITRINKRYPYIHPGTTKGYVAKLLVSVDQSGSVDDAMLESFFAELRSLNKNVQIDYLPFDCEAFEKDIVTWSRGKCPTVKRTRAGGTDFNAPTRIVNDRKNRGRWDGMLVMTDGECSAPIGSRVKRGWVVGKGQKLNFATNEIVIQMNDGKVNFGGWR